jgi:hypothetical protein
VDPDTDSDLAFFQIADPDPAFFLIADPDPGFDDPAQCVKGLLPR